MRKPVFDMEREIVETLCEIREDRIMTRARKWKKARWFCARFVRF
ncbi:MAG TPA: hypothetical protein VFF73_31270 [Planctomycetota bacterium]|nr:hypothetical protein [Planctomycetota bacterium]